MDSTTSTLISEIIEAHNKIRTDPQSFIPILEERLSQFDGKYIKRPGMNDLRTKEGPDAVK